MTAPNDLYVLLTELARRQLAAQSRLRVLRNVTVALCLVLAVVLPVFAVVIPHFGGSLVRISASSSPTPSTVTRQVGAGDLIAIEMWGLLGGLIGVLASVNSVGLSAANASLQVAQLVLKPLAGAAFALFAVIAVQGGLFNQLQPVDSTSIAAYSVLFGFAQEALTRMLDRRARSLLDVATPTSLAEP